MRSFIVRLSDLGCMQNLLPVADQLKNQGCEVSLYCDAGSIAAEKNNRAFPVVREFPAEAVVLSCLPLGEGYETITRQGNPIILVQENPDWLDARFVAWQDLPNVRQVCVLQKGPPHDKRAVVTGLPAIDEAAELVAAVDRSSLVQRLGLQNRTIVLVALSGNTRDCLRMLNLLQDGLENSVPVLRSHPKLKRDDPAGYDQVMVAVARLPNLLLSLDQSNARLEPHEAMALALGEGNYFVTTYDSTMAWQAAAAGVNNLFVLPPEHKPNEWVKMAPIVTSSLGEPYTGNLYPRSCHCSLLTGAAAERIADVVVSAS